MSDTNLEQLAINTIRTLSIDAVQAAKSGHPGTPMALAPLVYTIWNRAMNFDPKDPIWPNRDRFVLSNGHASMLLWSVLHLTKTQAVDAEYENLGHPSVSLDDIRASARSTAAPRGTRNTTGSRAWKPPPAHSARAWHQCGHGHRPEVAGEPVQQAWLRDLRLQHLRRVRRWLHDGGRRLRGGVLAGHLRLDNLCWIWDNNHITIEGDTNITFTEDVAARFLAYGWNVLRVSDANDIDRIEDALTVFRRTTGRPTFIVLDSHIGYGSPSKQGTPEAHGEPLGDAEIRPPSGRMAGPRTRSSSSPRASMVISLPASVSAARQRARTGLRSSRATATSSRIWRPRSIRCSVANCRPAGTKPAVVPGGCERSGRARGVGQGAQRAVAEHPVAARRFGGSRPLQQDRADLRGSRKLPIRHPGRQEPALRHPRTRDGRGGERHVVVQAPCATARRSSSSATTPGRLFGSRR